MVDVKNFTGQTFRNWTVGEEIGRGADGVVYRVTREGNDVALKLFFPEVVANNGLGEEQQRLELQLRLAGKKHHPNLVEISEGGCDEATGFYYLVMELVPGKSLDKLIGSIPRQSIAPLLKQLADVAKYLHGEGLVHRDIKPANIVVSDDFTLLTLLDLGIATEEGVGQDLSGRAFVATLRYSPPEFVWRKEVRADEQAWTAITYYQIGATLHDMLMGKPLFHGFDTPPAVLHDSVKLRTPKIEATDCEPWLAQIANACLIKNWRERAANVNWDLFNGPQSAEEDLSSKLRDLRLQQVLADQEKVRLAEEERSKSTAFSRSDELWRLQDELFLKMRQFLMGAHVFPRFSATHEPVHAGGYCIKYRFDKNDDLLFKEELNISILLKASPAAQLATDLTLTASLGSKPMPTSSWTEAFTAESAADLCQRALIEIAGQVMAMK